MRIKRTKNNLGHFKTNKKNHIEDKQEKHNLIVNDINVG